MENINKQENKSEQYNNQNNNQTTQNLQNTVNNIQDNTIDNELEEKKKQQQKKKQQKKRNLQKAKAKAEQLKREAARIPADYATKAKEIRKKRAKMLVIKLAVFVFFPTLIATVYYSFFATRMYQSEAVFSIQGFSGAAAGDQEIANGTVKEFVLSRTLFKKLNKNNAFIKHFTSKNIDWLSRLNDRSFESAFEYYKEIIRIDTGLESKVINLKIKAFSPKFAKKLNDQVLKALHHKLINLSDNTIANKTELAIENLKKAEEELVKTSTALSSMQKNSTPPAELTAQIETAQIKKNLAQKYYEAAMDSLKQAELSASKNRRYMAVISQPSLPDKAQFPKTGIKILTILMLSLGMFIILSLMLAAIKEHAKL